MPSQDHEPRSSETRSPGVSLVIPTYEREEELCQTLRCALTQTYPNLEIIVVDQARTHTPATQAFLEENAHRIRRVCSSVANLPLARNLGVAHSTGEIVIFVDDDVSFGPEFVANHVAYYREEAGIAGVAGHSNIDPPFKPFRPAGSYAPTAYGCNMSFRRGVILEVGGFDPRFSGNALGEENDFVYRMRRRGYRLANGGRALLHHHGAPRGGMPAGTEYMSPRWLEDYFRNTAFGFAKRFRGAAWLLPLFVLKNWRVYWRYFAAARDKFAFLRLLWKSHRQALRLARQPTPESFIPTEEHPLLAAKPIDTQCNS
ncbi:MAG: glycosyltransferase family 2 protein [Acidobacteriota bacterium]